MSTNVLAAEPLINNQVLPAGLSTDLSEFGLSKVGAVLLPKAPEYTEIPQKHLHSLWKSLQDDPLEYMDSNLLELLPEDIFFEQSFKSEAESRVFVRKALKAMKLRGSAMERQVEACLRIMWLYFSCKNLNCRFEIVSGNSCQNFHTDTVNARMILTCAGPGTQLINASDLSRSYKVKTGQPLLVKGSSHPTFQPVLLHRSPPVKGSGTLRLLFIADF